LLVRNRDDYVDASFLPPAIHHTVLTCATPKTIHMLDSFISPDMMERLHAGDVGGALECVGMTSHSEEELVEAVTASWRRELDTARRTHDFKKTLEYSSEAAKAKAMEGCEAKIAGLESRIAAIQDRVQKAKEQACPVCCEEATNPAVTPCCAQVFCFGCLCESLKRVAACPLCRERVTNLKTIKVLGTHRNATKEDKDKDKDKKKGKRETAIEYLKSLPPTSRTLIFSSYDASFSGLSDTLRAAELESQTVWGSQARVSKVLREFTDGKHTILLLNARNMGAGLNIEAATQVMLFHKMSKELETQIIGRAVRLGRAAPLQVVHLLHDNEVRENIVTYN
jgi:SNF2 family DNA or RNA helicase